MYSITLKSFWLILVVLASTYIHSQICLGDDATVCVGQPITITNCNGSGGGTSGGGVNLNAPTNVSLSDDVWSGVVNIGFPFSFYNNTYSQCVIGSNGLVSFDLSKANGYCAWSFGGVTPLPNTTFNSAKNSAMVCYWDMNPGVGGQIQYQTIGTAPNRIFVVLYKEVPTFSCNQCSYMSIMLFEGSNNIEYHIGNKPPCLSWNGGLALQATEDAPGTTAHVTPGRNISQWTANQECKRYVPTTPTNTSAFTIVDAPYTLVTSTGTSILWGSTTGQTFPYNNGVLNIPSVSAGTTGYFLTGSACGVGIGSVSADTSWITGVSSSVSTTSTPDVCSSGIGTATASSTSGVPPFTFTWSNGGTGSTISNLTAGSYTVTMTDNIGCPSTSTVVVGDTPATFTSTTTLVSCPGGSDGSATAVMTPVLGNLTFQWNDPLNQTTATATGLAAGTYQCVITSDIGCSGTATAIVNEIPATLPVIQSLVDVSCNSGNDGSAVLSITQGTGTAPFSYSWSSGTSFNGAMNNLTAGNYTVTITDANNCITTFNLTIDEPAPLQVTFITDTLEICPEATTNLQAQGTGGSSNYNFTWYENGSMIGTGQSIDVDPDNTNTQYCVVLSEACGSPTADSCTIINFYTPIVPNLTPDELKNCSPGEFIFTNTSTNFAEIATTNYQFSDGSTYQVDGLGTVTNTFIVPSYYDVLMTIESIYGCIYSANIQNVIEVVPNPVAAFTFSANPITIFEPSVVAQDQSTGNVVEWNWNSPYSSPSFSDLGNPTLTFPIGVEGQYPVTLTVYSEYGCVDSITHELNVVPDVLVFAPNTFTPNGDEHNQQWKVFFTGIDIYDFDLLIFNRWGELIWESHDPSVAWDGTYNGKIVQNGTYTWRAWTNDAINDKKREFSGYINVMR
jgi:gliding motility-associated-like protein